MYEATLQLDAEKLRKLSICNREDGAQICGGCNCMRLNPHEYERLNRLGEILRRKLRAIFDELEMPVQITGVASFFGINITDNEITNYRSILLRNQELNDLLFIGLVNEGVMIQSSGDGALSTLTTEAEIDEFADAVRRVILRIR